uniref:G_PROTEIN_RECEP_F1_2 domain-containing protein n=1 Tax=Meloidogyne hapla TaxID=6305 RepID=A0A1I8B5R4_MELHA
MLNVSSVRLPTRDPTYLAYKDAGITFEFIFPPIIYSLIALFGIPLNFSVCYITIKYRKQYSTFKSNTAILLLLNSIFEILNLTEYFFHLAIALSGKNIIPFGEAIYFQIHSLVGYLSAVFMFISLSFDRFLAAAFPI